MMNTFQKGDMYRSQQNDSRFLVLADDEWIVEHYIQPTTKNGKRNVALNSSDGYKLYKEYALPVTKVWYVIEGSSDWEFGIVYPHFSINNKGLTIEQGIHLADASISTVIVRPTRHSNAADGKYEVREASCSVWGRDYFSFFPFIEGEQEDPRLVRPNHDEYIKIG